MKKGFGSHIQILNLPQCSLSGFSYKAPTEQDFLTSSIERAQEISFLLKGIFRNESTYLFIFLIGRNEKYYILRMAKNNLLPFKVICKEQVL